MVNLYKLKENSYIADTAGFSLLDLSFVGNIEGRELSSYYPDFLDARSECKFRSCTHEGGDCGVLSAVKTGKINKKTGQERIFKLIKFRTMTCEKDENGELLPDEKRLTKYGSFLRNSSLDELPELINILIGDMSIVGPRPLLVSYLPLYNEEQRCRHNVRPGLTGYAQVKGRNSISWEEKFGLDVEYIGNISFFGDIKIILQTVEKVFKKEGISSETSATMEEFKGTKTE